MSVAATTESPQEGSVEALMYSNGSLSDLPSIRPLSTDPEALILDCCLIPPRAHEPRIPEFELEAFIFDKDQVQVSCQVSCRSSGAKKWTRRGGLSSGYEWLRRAC